MNKIYVITGMSGTGKTTFLSGFVEQLRQNGIEACGILSPAIFSKEERIGYNVMNIRTGEHEILCRKGMRNAEIEVGQWGFQFAGINFGNAALDVHSLYGGHLTIIDEVGPLELEGKVWSSSLEALIGKFPCPLLLVIRKQLIEQVSARWNFTPDATWEIKDYNTTNLLNEITNMIFPQYKTSKEGY